MLTSIGPGHADGRKTRMALAFALSALLNLGAAGQEYRFDSWTTDNGLPQVSVNSILQTRDGYLWLTTFGGLVRYDGLRFQVFNSGNTPGLRTSRFLNMLEDRVGDLWITTEGQGLTRYRDGRFTTYTTEHNLPANQIERIEESSGGDLLVTADERTYVWSDEAFTPYSPAAGEPMKNILHRKAGGAIWYLENSRLLKIENGRVTVDHAVDFPLLRAFEDSKGRVWIARDGDNLLLMLKDGKLTSYSAKDGYGDSRSMAIYEDRSGGVWFGTGSGIVRFQNDKFTRYTAADGLIGDTVTSIFQDREGTMWIGTTSGLSRLTARTITAYSASDGLAADNVYPIYQDRAGRIWIGSWQGLTVYENGIFRDVGERYTIADENITALFEDRDGAIWIGAWSGKITRIKDERAVTFPKTGSAVRVIYQDRAGAMWFGTEKGLIRYEASSLKSDDNNDSRRGSWEIGAGTTELTGKEIFAIHEDLSRQIWIGTSTGLVRYKDGVFTMLNEADGIVPSIVRSIYEDADGTLWVGMYDSGLYRFKDGRFTRYTTNEGLFDNGAFQVIEDGAENFWISCNLGIYRVKKSELNDFADGRIERIISIPYNKRDGMLNSECNGGASPAGIRASDGRIWFPTQKGVAVIDPQSVPFNSQPPPVVIQSLIVDTKPIDLREAVEIQPAQTNLEINYAGLSFINPELVKFKYQLEGLDADWIDAATRRTAFYSHLPPGIYRFRVTAANRDGVWNETGATFEITVLPAFYQTRWFIALAVLSVFVFIFAYYRWRIGNLKRAQAMQAAFARQLIESQETERRRIAAELHDSLGQSLVLIKNWALLGLKKTDEANPAKADLDEISETASEAINEVREIAYNLGPYQLDRIGLKRTVEEMIQKIAATSPTEFKTDIDEIDCVFTKEAEVNVFRIVQESVNNVVKHSRASEANIKIKTIGVSAVLTIHDNGKGFKMPESPDGDRGFGLLGMQERVNLLKGDLEIRSEIEKGTTIRIILPCETRTRE